MRLLLPNLPLKVMRKLHQTFNVRALHIHAESTYQVGAGRMHHTRVIAGRTHQTVLERTFHIRILVVRMRRTPMLTGRTQMFIERMRHTPTLVERMRHTPILAERTPHTQTLERTHSTQTPTLCFQTYKESTNRFQVNVDVDVVEGEDVEGEDEVAEEEPEVAPQIELLRTNNRWRIER